MSNLQTFLSKSTGVISNAVKCGVRKMAAPLMVPPVAKSRYDSVKAAPVRLPKKLKILQPFQTLIFPNNRSQVRGVDNVVHQLLQRRYRLKNFHPIMRNTFLSVQLFPRDHILSNFRKSNISLVFNMHQLPMLNDRHLESGFKSRPKYKDLQFFDSKPLPMQSACGRTKSKKQFKELFVKSLQNFSNHRNNDRLFGIFVFHVLKVPVNQEQNEVILRDLENMCLDLLDKDNKWNDLKNLYNKSKDPSPQQLKNVQYSYGAKGLLDRRVRFPFSNKRTNKILKK